MREIFYTFRGKGRGISRGRRALYNLHLSLVSLEIGKGVLNSWCTHTYSFKHTHTHTQTDIFTHTHTHTFIQ